MPSHINNTPALVVRVYLLSERERKMNTLIIAAMDTPIYTRGIVD